MARTKARVIILWSIPRSCSTMFEMAFVQRKEFRVLHEPFGEAFYFGPQRMSSRFTPEKRPQDFAKYCDLSFRQQWKELVERNAEGTIRTFVKDMSQYIVPPCTSTSTTPQLPDYDNDGNPTVIPSNDLLDPEIHHAFLIRSPQKAVPSYYRLCKPPHSAVTGFDYFEPEEVGLRESRLLYDWLVGQGRDPMVIDAARLLQDPIQTMRAFCEDCDVDFNEDMCHWSGEDAQEQFKKWAGFHDDAEKSQGIGKPHGSKAEREARELQKRKECAELPEAVQQAIADNIDHYEYFAERSLASPASDAEKSHEQSNDVKDVWFDVMP